MLGSSLSQAWPPFVLVASLLVIGAVAHRDGVFTRLGGMLQGTPGPPWVLFAASCLLLALTTALLNLDTAVVFVTPVIVHAARRRRIDHTGFLYAALFMVNASSLYLTGSNLTNLLVLARQPSHGDFAAGMFLPGLAATLVTALGLGVVFRAGLATGTSARDGDGAGADGGVEPAVRDGVEPAVRDGPGSAAVGGTTLLGPGALGGLVAATWMVILANPALAVAATALIVAAVAEAGRSVGVRELVRAASPQVLAAIFALAVGLGVLARAWGGPAHLLTHAGRPETAGIAALASVLINNLPAAVMLSAHALPHPRALLIGLDLGPNLAVTGSLAAFLWIRTAAQLGAQTSVVRISRLGVVLAPAAMAVALLVSRG